MKQITKIKIINYLSNGGGMSDIPIPFLLHASIESCRAWSPSTEIKRQLTP